MNTAIIIFLAILTLAFVYFRFVKGINRISIVKVTTNDVPLSVLGEPVIGVVKTQNNKFLVQHFQRDLFYTYILADENIFSEVLVLALSKMEKNQREEFLKNASDLADNLNEKLTETK